METCTFNFTDGIIKHKIEYAEADFGYDYERMLETKPEHIAVREMRKHIGWYLHGLRGASATRNLINRAANPEDVFSVLEDMFHSLKVQETDV